MAWATLLLTSLSDCWLMWFAATTWRQVMFLKINSLSTFHNRGAGFFRQTNWHELNKIQLTLYKWNTSEQEKGGKGQREEVQGKAKDTSIELQNKTGNKWTQTVTAIPTSKKRNGRIHILTSLCCFTKEDQMTALFFLQFHILIARLELIRAKSTFCQ